MLRSKTTNQTGAMVMLKNKNQKEGDADSSAVTDQNGTFEMRDLVPGKYVVVAKKRNKPNSPETSVTLAESEKKTVTIKLE